MKQQVRDLQSREQSHNVLKNIWKEDKKRLEEANKRLEEELDRVHKERQGEISHGVSFGDLELSDIQAKSSSDTVHQDAPSDETLAIIDLSELTEADRRAISSLHRMMNKDTKPKMKNRLRRLFGGRRNELETSTDTAEGQARMDQVYHELNEYTEAHIHDAIKEIVEQVVEKPYKMMTFMKGYAEICSKFIVPAEDDTDAP